MSFPFNIPKIQLALTLGLIFSSTFLYSSPFSVLLILVVVILATTISDFIFIKIRKINPFLLSAALVSGLIITLLYSPFRPWYEPATAAVLAMFSKNFLRLKDRHIFNPAAFGLFFASLIFGQTVSWWGVSFQQLLSFNLETTILFLILLSPGLVSWVRMCRYKIILPFLASYTLLSFLLIPNVTIFNTLLDPTVVFFSLVMLPEPMTSPNRPYQQMVFGVLVAILTFLSTSFFLPNQFINLLPDPLIFALLIGNLIFFFKK